MPVAAEHDDSRAIGSGGGVPHGFEQCLALGQVAGPGVEAVDAPVAGEGDAGDENLPLDAGLGERFEPR